MVVLAGWPTGSARAGLYRLPWSPGVSMELTQDCNDSFYADHIGNQGYAWDFANGTDFTVVAARAGVITHVKMSSSSGCDTPECVNLANYIVIDHGDGTSSIYLHLEQGSLDPSLACGAVVRQGQTLARAGSTGWSTATHLHYQVNTIPSGTGPICECGGNGRGCAPNRAAWDTFWSSPTRPAIPIDFDEWPARTCGDRRELLPVSQNVDTNVLGDEARRLIAQAWGQWFQARGAKQGGVILLNGIGGRK